MKYVLYYKKEDEEEDRKQLAYSADKFGIEGALKMYMWLWNERRSSFEIVKED